MTLFFDPIYTIERFKNEYNLVISKEFISCADLQLTHRFEKETGLKISNNLIISWVPKAEFVYEKDKISKLSFCLYVNNNWNRINILWKSKSERLYEISDSKIDCDDIVFYFEHLDVDLYFKQLYPITKPPFDLKGLPFSLKIDRLNVDSKITLELKNASSADMHLLVENINSFISIFNLKSEKNNRNDGVIHNWNAVQKPEISLIEFSIDFGSTGFSFLKKLLRYFSKFDIIASVLVE